MRFFSARDPLSFTSPVAAGARVLFLPVERGAGGLDRPRSSARAETGVDGPLAPEAGESYKGGVKSRLLGGRLDLELTAFQMDLTNIVVSQSVGGTPALTTLTAGSPVTAATCENKFCQHDASGKALCKSNPGTNCIRKPNGALCGYTIC